MSVQPGARGEGFEGRGREEKRVLLWRWRAPAGSFLCPFARQSPACPTRALSASEAVSVRRVPVAAARVVRLACNVASRRATAICPRACLCPCVSARVYAPSTDTLGQRRRTAGKAAAGSSLRSPAALASFAACFLSLEKKKKD